MTDSEAGRFDLLLWGATGFTGRLVAEYLAEHAPADLGWAIGGRDRGKLERLREAIGRDVEVVVGDATDPASVDAVVRRARVVATTVGPYARYGTPLVDACARHGVDYCDITAEVQWIRRNIDHLQKTAQDTGARIVHCCGFDSIPSDLGVLMMHDHLQRQGGGLTGAAYYVAALRGGVSGGTVASLLNLIGEASQDRGLRRILVDPYSLNPEGEREGVDETDQPGSRYDERMRQWTAPWVMAAINTRVVRRSNALMGYPYTRGFRYSECLLSGKRLQAAVVSLGLKSLMIGAVLGPTRGLLRRLLPKPGQGPSREKREAGLFKIVLLGEGGAAGPERVRGIVRGARDPGYAETSKMLAESALCLALDELPLRGGILTPASCMGMRLVERLRTAGMGFDVDEIPGEPNQPVAGEALDSSMIHR